MVESNQRKLAERIEDTNRRNEELDKLLDLQRQTLHQLQRPQPRRGHETSCSTRSSRSCSRRRAR